MLIAWIKTVRSPSLKFILVRRIWMVGASGAYVCECACVPMHLWRVPFLVCVINAMCVCDLNETIKEMIPFTDKNNFIIYNTQYYYE